MFAMALALIRGEKFSAPASKIKEGFKRVSAFVGMFDSRSVKG